MTRPGSLTFGLFCDMIGSLARGVMPWCSGQHQPDFDHICLPRSAPSGKPCATKGAVLKPVYRYVLFAVLAVVFGLIAYLYYAVSVVLGMMAIGSSDQNRFYPGMGTLFLDLLAQVVTSRLALEEPQKQRKSA